MVDFLILYPIVTLSRMTHYRMVTLWSSSFISFCAYCSSSIVMFCLTLLSYIFFISIVFLQVCLRNACKITHFSLPLCLQYALQNITCGDGPLT